MPTFLQRVRLTLDMIKFEHSVFALPFALTGALLAWRDEGFSRSGLWARLAWIVVCMVSARSVAMAFNRVLDHEIDARNPRTKMRHLPAGLLSRRFAWGFIAIWAFVFIFAARELNWMCFLLSPVALAIPMFYSFTKRFTSMSHIVLGFSLGIAPAAAWIAMRGSLDWRIVWLTAAVTLWTAGFDIIYACQDYAFDVHAGLYSIPKTLGIAGALWMSRALHLGMLICLLALVKSFALGPVALAGVAAVAGLLLWEHRLVRADDLSRIDAAFFTMNGYVSVIFFVFWATDIFLK
ncbi:MAG: putative 4-hydroxybenzoate polyprenyltransferase [Acidobacteriia bacterium]|nr:putative 4-hydroxybenzoate polyprenyltransferase [Terriglobia bacterium]